MPNRGIRILLVDDHMVVRAGLAQVLGAKAGFTVVGEAESGEEALFLCHQHQPHVVLMDVVMQGMGGIGATEAIRKYQPNTRVIALSTFADGDTIAQLLAAGASGFLPKTISAEELVDAIKRVHAGETIVLSGPASPEPVQQTVSPGEIKLSGQQRRVLALLTRGYTNGEIAAYLRLSLPTARYHVSAILLKLGVSNRAEAAALAERNRLVGEADF
ncbi:response regulator transcription factor [Altererythrobacter sp. CC-YST694]|uniref:response regulator transcription factor n=1 Tax=Altererythrobacter sp. CC-YST694 TaxID=2755038 RepID=UPI001D022B9A|nr:response regulator transcription factor [Altererythrobacter sp. CC-YST694]MCB5425147.1 response regulator transcription factor [Altererythrobacter sp. CC-YST694]